MLSGFGLMHMMQRLKKNQKLVTEAPILKYYDVSKEVTIQCDASQNRFGCVLLQNGQPVAFDSKTMTETEKRYAQIKK